MGIGIHKVSQETNLFVVWAVCFSSCLFSGASLLDRLNIYSVYSGLFDPCFFDAGWWLLEYAVCVRVLIWPMLFLRGRLRG